MTTGEGDEGRAIRDWELIRRVVADANRRILARVTDGTFHEPSFGVLSALLHAPDHRLPMSRLAREAAMTTGGFTRLADRLGSAGFIDRRGSDDDRRVIYASLTAAGLDEARRLERRYLDAMRDEVLGVLDQAALRAIADTLGPLDVARGSEPDLGTSQAPAADRRSRPASGTAQGPDH